MSADNSAQIKSSKQALIYMYVDLLPKNSAQKFPTLSEAVRIKQTGIG